MTRSENRVHGSPQSHRVSGHTFERVIWVMGIVAIGILLAYVLLPSSRGRQTSSDVSKVVNQVKGEKESAGQQANIERTNPRTSLVEQEQTSVRRAIGGSTEEISQGYEGSQRIAREHLQDKRTPSYSDANQLMIALAQMKPRHGKWSPEELNEIYRLIQELILSGRAGFMAICEFLESGEDVSFAQYTGKIPPKFESLRVALIDALAQMGGQETTVFLASMLNRTKNPEEITLLAKTLEKSAPGVYRAEILNTVRTMLDLALNTQYQWLGRLFGVIQDYGDASFAIDLENTYRKFPSPFPELALMVLSKLPNGDGMPSLLRTVNEMSGDPGAYGMTYELALRYLTQASREYPEAGEALLRLATANKISTSGFIQVANALGGTEYHLITKSSDFSIESRVEIGGFSRAEIGGFKVVETWSNVEIDQRLGLIDQLLRTKPQQAAVKALLDARNRLQGWK